MKSSSLDTLTAKERSERMSRVRSKDMGPEMRVRRLVYSMGFRYRLHDKGFPGCPDLVFRPRRKVIFVHGCFWHRHSGCRRTRLPKSPERQGSWRKKFDANVSRDQRHEEELRAAGWEVMVVWGCATDDLEKLREKLLFLLG